MEQSLNNSIKSNEIGIEQKINIDENNIEKEKNNLKELEFQRIPEFIINKKYYNLQNLLDQEEQIKEEDIQTNVLFKNSKSKFKLKKKFNFLLNIRFDEWVK
jgi:hypothetical protein